MAKFKPGDKVKIHRAKGKISGSTFKKFVGDSGVVQPEDSVTIKMLDGEWKGATIVVPIDVIQPLKENVGENKTSKKEKLDEGMVMISSLLPVGQVVGLSPKREDNFEFKGLPGQFNEKGEKFLDEQGQPLQEKEKPDYKYYKNLLADVEDGLNELVNIGEDYEVFQSAKHAAKALKQAYKLVNSVR